CAGRFAPSAHVLGDAPMPDQLFEAARRMLAGSGLRLPATPQDGRAQALRACREYRAKPWHLSMRAAEPIIREVRRANRLLARATHEQPFRFPAPTASLPTPDTTSPMSMTQTVRIDGND